MEHPLLQPAAMRIFRTALLVTAVSALAAVPVAGCIAVDSLLSVDCVSHEVATETLQVPNTDPALDFKIQRCKLDASACADLCALVLSRTQPFAPTTCKVDVSDSQAVVHVGYDQPTNASGCTNGPLAADDVGSGMPVGGGGSGGTFPVDAGVPPTSPIDAP